MESAAPKENVLGRLAATLTEYLDAVPRQKEPNPPDLMALFDRLDALEKELGPDSSAQLRHYMHQKSYRKAHLFLQGQDAETHAATAAADPDLGTLRNAHFKNSVILSGGERQTRLPAGVRRAVVEGPSFKQGEEMAKRMIFSWRSGGS